MERPNERVPGVASADPRSDGPYPAEQPVVTVSSGEPGHVAARPSWDCAVCGRPWPCDPAREELASTLTGVGLAMQMWVYLESAAEDLRAVPVQELFERFLSWTRPHITP